MPQISDSQLARLGQEVTTRQAAIVRLRDQLKSKATQDNAVVLATAGAGAAAFGYLRGKMENKTTGAWNVPGVPNLDWEAVAVLACGALALGGGMISKQFKKLEAPATHVCAGILGHYLGQLARKMGHTGSFSLVAGDYGMLPSPGAGESSLSFRQTQYAAPYSDPIASALAESGV
jgi:hypothetical protein